MKKLFWLLFLAIAGCNDSNLQNRETRSDTTMQSIDSSSIINDDTPLPRDSTATGVQH